MAASGDLARCQSATHGVRGAANGLPAHLAPGEAGRARPPRRSWDGDRDPLVPRSASQATVVSATWVQRYIELWRYDTVASETVGL